MDIIALSILELCIEISVFLVLVFIGIFIYKRFKNNSDLPFNSTEFLPEEEIHSLKQVFYLIMMSLAFINVMNSIVFSQEYFIYYVIFDVILSLFVAVTLIDRKTWKGKFIILLLVPYGALNFVLTSTLTISSFLDIGHTIIFVYIVKLYYDKFREYTESNGLGIAVILLFTLIFVSFIFTQFVEGVNPLDALIMVSNAFTSNGYAVLGDSIMGKLNSLLLVWGGYVLSGVGTATLTAAILTRHFNKRFDHLEELIKNNNED